jgi:hypothetical protein
MLSGIGQNPVPHSLPNGPGNSASEEDCSRCVTAGRRERMADEFRLRCVATARLGSVSSKASCSLKGRSCLPGHCVSCPVGSWCDSLCAVPVTMTKGSCTSDIFYGDLRMARKVLAQLWINPFDLHVKDILLL